MADPVLTDDALRSLVAQLDAPRPASRGVPMALSAVQARALSCAADLAREVLALRAIVEGRTTPPTDAEIEAHEAAGGHFRWQARETSLSLAISPTGCSGWHETPGDAWGDVWERSHVVERPPPPDARWWALDADGRPCAWPTAEAPRG